MKEPRWLTAAIIRALHSEALARFGGAGGIRDETLLESALARPLHAFTCDRDPNRFDLAAVYGYGIIRNHPFVDGNKRAGVLAIAVFLHLNGWRFDPDQSDEVRMIQAVAAGEIGEKELAAWVQSNAVPHSAS
ncbi:MAG: type II toxin-antitoxin system death-on-curing family toxin [Rhodospirillales bacterium]|nr:type II toxin-antitoxin system death-on-curing family toxin [Rhodospirillales bacterium]